MANRIKGITVEIGGDTTGLDKALKGVNNTIKTSQSSLKDVSRLLKLDPSNAQLLAQKQKLLSTAIKETSDKLNPLVGEIPAGLFYTQNEKVMPRKPKRPCSYPSCPKLYDGQFCTEREKLNNQHYEKYKRSPEAKKRYGRLWRKIRESYVKAHPFCEVCFKEGRMKKVEEVHHIKPLSEGGTHDRENLISLCQSCHSKIHARNGSRWHKKATP